MRKIDRWSRRGPAEAQENFALVEAVSQETRNLIRQMSRDNPLWGAPESMENSSSLVSTSAKAALGAKQKERDSQNHQQVPGLQAFLFDRTYPTFRLGVQSRTSGW